MTITKQQCIDMFKMEWEMREAFLKADKRNNSQILKHRKEIMHLYRVTEEDLAQDLERNKDDTRQQQRLD